MHFIAFFYGWLFVTIANTESRFLLRKGRYMPTHRIRIVSIRYGCNYVTTRICILSRFSTDVTIANTESRYLLRKGRYFPPHHIRIVSICYVCNTLLPRYVFYRVFLWNLRKMYSHATINLN